MKSFYCQAILIAILLVCTACTYTVTAQGGCNTLPTSNGLIAGNNKDGVIPYVRASPGGTVH